MKQFRKAILLLVLSLALVIVYSRIPETTSVAASDIVTINNEVR